MGLQATARASRSALVSMATEARALLTTGACMGANENEADVKDSICKGSG